MELQMPNGPIRQPISADSITGLGDGRKHRVYKKDRIRAFFESFRTDKKAYIIADKRFGGDDANDWDLYE